MKIITLLNLAAPDRQKVSGINKKMLFALIFFAVCLAQEPVKAVGKQGEPIINISFKQQPVKYVLQSLEEQTGFRFFYLNNAVNTDKKVTINLNNASLDVTLQELSKVLNVTFQITGKQIVLIKKRNKAPEAIVPPVKPARPLISFASLTVGPITGKVTDENGTPLPGVTVVVKGTNNGTVTDASGGFNLNVPDGSNSLVVSFIGYISQEVAINNQTTITVSLKPDAKALDEVVVVAYGRQEKTDVIGSISTIKSEQITEVPSANFINGLQGRASGLQITGSSGVPGAPAKVLIRGVNSISSNADPLYVIDGMPMFSGLNGLGESNNSTPQNPMATINPNDIESIEVLKDAAATAVYGSRGANGVILITTKSGRSGKGGLNVDFSTGVSELTRTAEDVGFASSAEYFSLMDQALANSGYTVPFDPMRIVNLFPFDNTTAVNPITREQALATNTDWFDQILRTGSFRDISVSANRGAEKPNFYTSANYREDDGVLKNNNFKRFSGRVNLDFEPVKNLRTGVRLNVSYTDNDRVKSMGSNGGFGTSTAAGGWSQANFSAQPWYPVYRFDDPTQYWNPLSINNLVARIDPRYIADNIETYRGIGGLWAEYFLPWVKGLSLRTEGSFDLMQANSINWVSRDIMVNPNPAQDGSYASEQGSTSKNFNYNLYANYVTTVGVHNFNISAGTESMRSTGFNRFMAGNNLNGTRQWLGTPGLFSAIQTGMSGEKYIRGYFTRANYKLKDKYLVGLSFRRDGSSTFRPDLRWGNFLALSAGWILSEEAFMRSLPFVNFLKIRGSYGETGNEGIPGGTDVIGFTGNRRYGLQDAGGAVGTNVSNLPALDITWETTESYDVGLDYGFLDNRISGSAVYFQRNVTDMLLQVPLPPSVQPSQIWGNVGDMQNKGFEFNISTVNVHAGDFRWTTNLNLTAVRNKVQGLTAAADASGKGLVVSNTVTKTGERLGTWFMADYAGIDPDKGIEMIWEIDRSHYDETGETLKTGRKIPATNVNLTNHRYYHQGKTTLPTLFGGFENTFSYKGFDLSALFSFSGGNYLYDNNEKMGSYAGTGGGVLRKSLIGNTWTPDSRDATYPQLRWEHIYPFDNEGNPSAGTNYSNQNLYHSKYLYKGDYIRLRNLQLGYNLPANLTQRLKMQGIRLFVTGTNLLTFTDFPGWDPEVITNTGGGQGANLAQGFIGNNLPLPQLKTYTLGVSAKF